MSRPLRFIPPGHLIEVTARTVQGRSLLKPSPGFREIVIGILARAKERNPVQIHAYAFLSNHYHLLLTPGDAKTLAQFMCYLNTNLSKEAARLHGWRGPLFGRRYRSIIVTHEEEEHLRRLEYVLSHGCKEGLVEKPTDWPGAHSANSMLSGVPDKGVWFDRTREYGTKEAGRPGLPSECACEYELRLDPLPSWAKHDQKSIQAIVKDLILRVVTASRAERALKQTRPLGIDAILSQDPQSRPRNITWSPAPLVHAATRKARLEILQAYRSFTRAFRAAGHRLRDEKPHSAFPDGSFPPPLPFKPLTKSLVPT